MEIVHFCPRPAFSGLEAYALLLADEQKKAGHKVSFVVLPGSPLEEKVRAAGIAPIIHNKKCFWGSKLFGENKERQILHLHSTLDVKILFPWLQLAKAFGRLNAKVILQTHIWIDHKKKDPWHWLLYKSIDELWCSSTRAKQNIASMFPVPNEKIVVVNYGRHVEKMEKGFFTKTEARQKLKLPPEALVVGSINRIDQGKGTLEFLDALIPELSKRDDLHLLWIGPPTGHDENAKRYSQTIYSKVKALPAALKSRIHFPGAIPDAYQLLKAFDLYILPTYNECFSLALLEAQLAGLPALGTNSGGTPEVIQENKTGWLFEPNSVDDLQKCFSRALADISQWNTFGQNARLRVISDFNFTEIFPRLLEQYDKL